MKKIIVIILCFFLYQLKAQSNFTFGWLPKINISAKTSEKTKWVNSIEAREEIYNQEFNFLHKLIDVTSVFSIKINTNQSLNLGYVVRFSKAKTIHRLLQHYNFIVQLDNFKLANRLGFEQFFSSKSKTQYRVRYRATFQKPLSGQRIDAKEFYIKFANEYLYQLTKKDLEIRLAPYIGYQLSKKEKLEFGFDYRLGKLRESNQKQGLWFRTTWYILL